jgi:hypothetical protein
MLQEGETYQLQGDSLRLTVVQVEGDDVAVRFSDGTIMTYDAERLDEQARNGTLVVVA